MLSVEFSKASRAGAIRQAARVACVGWILTLWAASVRAGSEMEIPRVEMGIAGYWKIGFETEHRFLVVNRSQVRQTIRFELRTVDGDGTTVRYTTGPKNFELPPSESITANLVAKHGRANNPIKLVVFEDGTDRVLLERVVSEEERGTAIPADHPWIVGIGMPPMKLDSAAMISTKGGLADYITAEVSEAQRLPLHWEAYRGVDLLVFSSSNSELLKQVTEEQSNVLRNWVLRGGRCLLTLGGNAKEWFRIPSFASLVPGTFSESVKRCSPGPLESDVNSQNPLEPIDSAVIRFETFTPEIELRGQTANRQTYPLIAKWTIGVGKVRMLATEIDSNQIKQWSSQQALIKKLLNEQWETKGTSAKSIGGLDDLSVQLNRTLDRFDTLVSGNLTQMSLLLGILLTILGPIDYFLVAKKWKRPRGTWITLAITSLGFCAMLIGLQRTGKPTNAMLNALEVVDVDAGSRFMMGHTYAHLYGGSRGEFSIAAQPANHSLTAKSSSDNDVPMNLHWLGQPGKNLGGFDSSIATDRVLPPYQLGVLSNGSPKSSLDHVGIPEAGTKGIEGYWFGTIPDTMEFSRLSSIPGAVDLLEGSFVNPLPVDLENGILVYRRRFYSLPLKIRTGDRITFSVNEVPKDLSRRLQRRFIVDGKDQGTPWDRNDTSNVKRLAEMLAFHRAAGKASYTGTIHRYLSHLDQSELLDTERAILYAEVTTPEIDWEISRDGVSIDHIGGNRATVIRVLLPVYRPSRKTENSNP